MSRISPEMRGRLLVAAQIAWVLVGALSVGLFIAAMPRYYHQALTLTNQDGFITRDPTQWRVGLHQLGLSPAFYAAFAVAGRSLMAASLVTTGAVIFLRRSRDPFLLFLSLSLLIFGCTTPPVSGEFNDSALGVLVQILATGGQSFLLVLYLFPDGRFVPRWTRLCAMVVLGSFLLPVRIESLLLVGLGITFVIAPVYRYRYVADATQRQQMKWALFGLALAIITLVVDLSLYPLCPSIASTDRAKVLYDFATLASNVFSFSLVPVFVGIAILRYRLWEIDTIVNRTLVYGSLTVSLGLLYIGGVIALQSLTRVITGQSSELAVAVVTLAIAALFNPWRRRLQVFIDRRFYRRRYDAARTLSAFSASLRDEVDLDDLSRDLMSVLQETVQPSEVALWLRHAEGVHK